MSIVGATAITAFVNTIWQDAVLVARDNNVMSGLVTNFSDRSGTALRENSRYSSASLATLGDETDMTGGTFTPAPIATVTPHEIGAQLNISDLRMESDPFDVRNSATMELGQAMATKIEQDLLSAGTLVTGGTISSIGTAMTWSNFYAMLSILRNQKAPFPFEMVLHPFHWHALGKTLSGGQTVTNMPALQNAIGGQFYVGSVSGVNIYVSANVAGASAAATPAILFNRAALALDMRRAPRIELQRDASLRSWELNLSTVYGAGIWRPEFGVKGLFDATAPTG